MPPPIAGQANWLVMIAHTAGKPYYKDTVD